jgi:hypothetical protein
MVSQDDVAHQHLFHRPAAINALPRGSSLQSVEVVLDLALSLVDALQHLLLRDELFLRVEQIVLESFHPLRQVCVLFLELGDLRRGVAAA